jgi:hypothetical protein
MSSIQQGVGTVIDVGILAVIGFAAYELWSNRATVEGMVEWFGNVPEEVELESTEAGFVQEKIVEEAKDDKIKEEWAFEHPQSAFEVKFGKTAGDIMYSSLSHEEAQRQISLLYPETRAQQAVREGTNKETLRHETFIEIVSNFFGGIAPTYDTGWHEIMG